MIGTTLASSGHYSPHHVFSNNENLTLDVCGLEWHCDGLYFGGEFKLLAIKEVCVVFLFQENVYISKVSALMATP